MNIFKSEKHTALSQFVEQCPFAVAMLDNDMKYILVSHKWISDFRLSPKDIYKRSHYDLFPEIPEHWKQVHQRCLAGATERHEGEAFLRADGLIDWVRWEVRPWYDDSGKIGGVLMFSEDISERKKMEEALRKALATRDEFLSIASHELKTPLSSLSLQLQLMEEKVLTNQDPWLNGAIQLCLRQSESLTELVDDLLDVSRIQAGKLTLNPQRMDLSDLIADVISRFSTQLAAAQITLNMQVSEKIYGTWDRRRIGQVIVNLISNAIKYAPGSNLLIVTKLEGDFAFLSVEDTGPGIDGGVQERIFNKYQRANKLKGISGLGLGLFIVKRVVEAHKGSVSVESMLGQGSKFSVKIPIDPPFSNLDM